MAEVENQQQIAHPDVLGNVSRTPVVFTSPLLYQVEMRVNALKKLQVDYFKVQAEFHKEVAELEHKYFTKYNVLTEKRRDIVNGMCEPTEAECGLNDAVEKTSAEQNKKSSNDASVVGIPSFWLTCMKNVADDIPDFVTEEDEPILEHLTDIVVEDNIESFKLHFHFSSNEYFNNTVLTKEFKLKIEPNEEDPLNFEGPELVAMRGTRIDWKSHEKDVTKKQMTNTQKNKRTGETRTVSKTVRTESFFNFFCNPEWVEDSENMSHELEAAFQADVSLGSFFRERLVPRAVLYFTGEVTDDENDDDDDDDDDDDYEDDLNDFEEADSDAGCDSAAGCKPIQQFLNQANQGNEECRQQ